MPTREEFDKLEKQADEVINKAARTLLEALMGKVRIVVQRDMTFMLTGDKSLVDPVNRADG